MAHVDHDWFGGDGDTEAAAQALGSSRHVLVPLASAPAWAREKSSDPRVHDTTELTSLSSHALRLRSLLAKSIGPRFRLAEFAQATAHVGFRRQSARCMLQLK
jgi:hypothetical protein